MAVFEYKAVAKTGKPVKGVIDAESAAAARRKLRDQDLYPTGLNETFEGAGGEDAASGGKRGRMSVRDVAMMTRQLAVLLQAGMPLVESMSALLEQTSNARLKKVVYDIRSKVNEGMRLADALRAHPKVFNELYVNMVAAGEASGALEAVLLRLADVLERQVRLKKRILSTLLYPAFMVLVSIAVIVLLLVAVVPRITVIFAKQEQDLPTPTQILINVSDFVIAYWWVMAIVGAALYVLWRAWVATPKGRLVWDRLKLKLPLLGPLYLKVITGRLARTLGTMLESGLTMLTSLEVVKTVVQNRVVEDAMEEVKRGVRRGRDLARPLREAGIFPPLLIHMTELGQRSGEIEPMMLRIADTYDEDVELSVEAVVGVIQPIIILVMGGFVMYLVVSILLPILEMSQGFASR